MRWIPDLSHEAGPIYRAIADALAAAVADGRLKPGEKLPPQRALADRLGVDLTTVTRAYAEAAKAGLVVGEGRRGTFVRQRGAQSDMDAVGPEVASGMNMPPEPEDNSLRQRMAEGVAALLKERMAPLHYQPAGGNDAQRTSAAMFLSDLIPDTSPDQCIVTAGSQQSVHAVLTLLAKPGDRIAAGCFAYPGFLAAARRLGATLIPLRMDEDGIVPDALEEAAAAGLKALYVNPTNDNPTTATLPMTRRRKIAQLASKYGFAIIEDDAYGRLPAEPLAPLAALAPERCWHFVTMSKLISPSLRVGFVRAPSVGDALDLAAITHETGGMAPPVNAALVARWLDDGSFARLVAAVRAEASVRMEHAASLLGPLGARWHPEGYHLWLPLQDEAAAARAAASAVAAGLPAVSSAAFALDPDSGVQALRISLGGSATRGRVKREIERLHAVLTRTGGGERAFV